MDDTAAGVIYLIGVLLFAIGGIIQLHIWMGSKHITIPFLVSISFMGVGAASVQYIPEFVALLNKEPTP